MAVSISPPVFERQMQPSSLPQPTKLAAASKSPRDVVDAPDQSSAFPDRLDSVDSGVSDGTDSAASVSPDWRPRYDPISSSMEDLVGDQLTPTGGAREDDDETVKRIAVELAFDLVRYSTTGDPRAPANSHCKTLRRFYRELAAKHETMFIGLVNKLSLTDGDLDCKFLEHVADHMFSDDQYNWGRIVTLYVFAAWLARHCVEKRMSSQWPERIADKIGKFVVEKATSWIGKHGGWDAMAENFKEPDDIESKMWKGLLFTALGLGALAATVAIVR